MKKILIIILSFLMQMISFTIFGQQLQLDNQDKGYKDFDFLQIIDDRKSIENFQEPIKLENPVRRFEITFFISAPFTFFASYLFLNIFDVVKDSIKKGKYDGNVNVWKEYKPALLAGTFGISSAIASREAWICIRTNKEKKRQYQNEQTISVSINKNF